MRKRQQSPGSCHSQSPVALLPFLIIILLPLYCAVSPVARGGPAAEALWIARTPAETAVTGPTAPSAGMPVQINRDAVARIGPGSLVELPIGAGLEIFHIQRVVAGEGVRTLYGANVQGGPGRLVMTLSEHSSYATVSTPRGTYNLRGGPGGTARLYSSAELNRHRDFTLRDYTTVKPDLEGQ